MVKQKPNTGPLANELIYTKEWTNSSWINRNQGVDL